jgi:hypothetical protein
MERRDRGSESTFKETGARQRDFHGSGEWTPEVIEKGTKTDKRKDSYDEKLGADRGEGCRVIAGGVLGFRRSAGMAPLWINQVNS